MRGNAKSLFAYLLTAILLLSLAVFAVSVPAQVRGQTRQVEQPSDYKSNSVENPADKMSWTAWYKDTRSNYTPEFHSSTLGPDGNMVAVGSVTDESATPIKGDLILAKYGPDGQALPGWPRLYSDANYPGTFKHWSEGQEVLVDSSGNITVAGYSIENNIWYASIWRFDPSGNVLPGWPQYTIGDTRAWVMGIIIDRNGDIVCCGATGSTTRETLLIVKYRQNGTPAPGWPRYYTVKPGQNLAYDIIQDSDGNYVVAGYTSSDPPPSINRDAILCKIDTSGTQIPGWLETWDSGSGQDDEYYSVSQDTNGDYCLVGVCQGTTDTDGKLLVTRFNKDGNQITPGWPQVYAQGGLRDYSPPDSWRGSVDPSGNIAAAVTCESGAAIHTVKFKRDGSMFYGFPRVFNRVGYDDVTRSCMVDGQGNIYTVGYSRLSSNPEADYSTFVIKYPPEYVWYLAEGSTGSDSRGSFETWVLVQNPTDETANAQLYYQTPAGEVTGHKITLAPHTRETRNVADFVPNEWSVSTKVVSDRAVIAERAMYWSTSTGVYREAAHDSIGYDP